jgi:hypothetical protein
MPIFHGYPPRPDVGRYLARYAETKKVAPVRCWAVRLEPEDGACFGAVCGINIAPGQQFECAIGDGPSVSIAIKRAMIQLLRQLGAPVDKRFWGPGYEKWSEEPCMALEPRDGPKSYTIEIPVVVPYPKEGSPPSPPPIISQQVMDALQEQAQDPALLPDSPPYSPLYEDNEDTEFEDVEDPEDEDHSRPCSPNEIFMFTESEDSEDSDYKDSEYEDVEDSEDDIHSRTCSTSEIFMFTESEDSDDSDYQDMA